MVSFVICMLSNVIRCVNLSINLWCKQCHKIYIRDVQRETWRGVVALGLTDTLLYFPLKVDYIKSVSFDGKWTLWILQFA
jgi:hypothetical protein